MNSIPIQFKTERLHLVGGSSDLARAEMEDPALFSRLLDAAIPTDWPPPLNNRDTLLFNLRRLEIGEDQQGWWSWYFILKATRESERILIGNGGYKGPPDNTGTVELGYSICLGYQNQGFATEAVFGLVCWAFQQDDVRRITAEILLDSAASIRVLEKNNFEFQSEGFGTGALRYILTRDRFQSIMEL